MSLNNTPSHFSVVLPVFNEQENLQRLFEELEVILKSLNQSYEIIFINDGSTDDSLKLLNIFCNDNAACSVIDFKNNRGQSTALWAGILKAQGQYIITMDSDLQNDPNDLLEMTKHLTKFDMVTGWRHQRKDNCFTKISSSIANVIRNKLSEETIKDTGCSLKIMKTSMLKRIRPFNGMHRFLPTLMQMEGAKVIEVPVNHRPRLSGHSNYGVMNRIIPAFIDLLAVRWMKKRKINFGTKNSNEYERDNDY